MRAGLATVALTGGLVAWLVGQGAWYVLGGWLVLGSGVLVCVVRRWAAEGESVRGDRIARYLTADERARACAETYTASARWQEGDHPAPRTADGCCPLGVALGLEGAEGAPASETVAHELLSRGRCTADERDRLVLPAALAFIWAWDEGRIADLRAAWGLEDVAGGRVECGRDEWRVGCRVPTGETP